MPRRRQHRPLNHQNLNGFVREESLGKPVSGTVGTGGIVRIIGFVSVAAATIFLAGCGYTPEQRATSGAALGGATGAAIGAAAGGGPGAALAGGILGAATGAVVGANTAPPPPPPPPPGYYPPPPPGPPRCARMGYDPYGNPVCLNYYGY